MINTITKLLFVISYQHFEIKVPYSHTDKSLYKRIKKIYKLANYEI